MSTLAPSALFFSRRAARVSPVLWPWLCSNHGGSAALTRARREAWKAGAKIERAAFVCLDRVTKNRLAELFRVLVERAMDCVASRLRRREEEEEEDKRRRRTPP